MAISLANSSCSPTRLGLLPDDTDEKGPPPKQSMWHRLGLRRWLGRDDRDSDRDRLETSSSPHNINSLNNLHNRNSVPPNPHLRSSSANSNNRHTKHDNLTRRLSRKVGVGLPRSTTFKRQNSERRDRLTPFEADHRRTVSADRRPSSAQSTRTRSPLPAVDPRLSAPEVQWLGPTPATTVDEFPDTASNDEPSVHAHWEDSYPDLTITSAPEVEAESERGERGQQEPGSEPVPVQQQEQQQQQVEEESIDPPAPEPVQDILDMELDQRWILNLSMHFRDRSEREKFFITYAETPTRWRRVTISCDYRDAPPDSLEQDLKELRYQRDKSARIYESIRESLPEIQFYDTVTNLKVETRDGRLHVHVTEDVNETIPYPPISSIGHLRGARCVPEHFLHFDAHLSGFVYKVQLGGRAYIKKEIPGPDTVDEFLYEINALHALNGAPNVIRVEAIVVDERQQVVKGLLISYAEQGALVDILYERRGQISFARRERWAKQIVQGLCEIHESGYVQGDFTLSNIVVDAEDNAHIIDINRRGCPVGWEPPEIAAKIESNQRISMYIGVKTDLYQLGMTLWALAMGEDEPERQPRPLFLGHDANVPDYYRRLVDICLSPSPRHRLAAKELLHFFPAGLLSRQSLPVRQAPATYGSYERTLAPLVTKTNYADPLPMVVSPDQLTSRDLSEQKYSDTNRGEAPHSTFSGIHDQEKRSTLTLAESNGDAFPSRHSSASTLNHPEPPRGDKSWDQDDLSRGHIASDMPADHQKIQNAVPSFWAHAMSNSPENSVSEQQPHFIESPTACEDYPERGSPNSEDSMTSMPAAPVQVPVSSQNKKPRDSVSEILNKEDQKYDIKTKSVSFDSPDRGLSHSTPSLLLSALPINPALRSSSRRSLPADTTKTKLRNEDGGRYITSLTESQLPINPALGIFQRRQFPLSTKPLQPPFPSATQPESFRQKLISFLSDSRLPINPGFKDKFTNMA
ncbi:hypothetical protein N7462_011176 [Penicillium macrosclerotiorum]|uniref:uncharacterized protein n=1 Tax=Penicillium macrosclerotiorum TaxID=303699 RepID=UPI00254713E0|nr:uncharacterized protein N7462_011176 [Penicillium macrosclerotiorum]KAJ5666767.1 hypothetical protein N7462_011176 [Penicillium macrosclerotiorum]